MRLFGMTFSSSRRNPAMNILQSSSGDVLFLSVNGWGDTLEELHVKGRISNTVTWLRCLWGNLDAMFLSKVSDDNK